MPFKTYQPSKADAARAVAAQLKADGKPVRPKTVLEILARRGIIMDPGQCSVITGEFRKRPKRRWTRRTAAKVAKNGRAHIVSDVPVRGQCLTRLQFKDYASLILASQFAKSCGGIDKATKTLADLAAIVDPLTKS